MSILYQSHFFNIIDTAMFLLVASNSNPIVNCFDDFCERLSNLFLCNPIFFPCFCNEKKTLLEQLKNIKFQSSTLQTAHKNCVILHRTLLQVWNIAPAVEVVVQQCLVVEDFLQHTLNVIVWLPNFLQEIHLKNVPNVVLDWEKCCLTYIFRPNQTISGHFRL